MDIYTIIFKLTGEHLNLLNCVVTTYEFYFIVLESRACEYALDIL